MTNGEVWTFYVLDQKLIANSVLHAFTITMQVIAKYVGARTPFDLLYEVTL